MTLLAIVDSEHAARSARAAHPSARIVTDNPLLSAACRDVDIENIDAAVTQAEALRLGTLAIDIAHAIDRGISDQGIVRRFDLVPGFVYTAGITSRMLASLLHRGAVLSNAIETARPSAIGLYLIDTPAREPAEPFMPPRFSHPARALSERGFFGDIALTFEPVAAELPAQINDTATDDVLRRIALFSPGVVLHELLRRIPGFAGGGARVLVGEENEAIRETLPSLRAHGVSFTAVGALVTRLTAPVEESVQRHVPVDPLVEDKIGSAVHAGMAKAGFQGLQQQALARVVLEHVSAGLAHLRRRVSATEERLSRLFNGKSGILVTNGLFGPGGAQAYGLCRRHNVTVVEFEHGVTAGISALTDRKLAHGGMISGDVLLVCSDRAVQAFSEGKRDRGRIIAVGLPNCVRRLRHKPLQRRLARRALGLLRGNYCVMHVSTLTYSGNYRPGLGTPSETTTYDIDRTLIGEVYPRIPHQVVFKQYPTQRFPFEPDYNSLFELAPNIRITKDEDFRYIRAAADVIVTMTPTSTLGWCVGAEKPLVWLDSNLINPLSSSDLRNAFRAAFLTVDIDEPGWPDRLRGLLSRSPAEIAVDWEGRKAARDALLRDAILGAEGAGRRAADLICDLVRGKPKVAGSGAEPVRA